MDIKGVFRSIVPIVQPSSRTKEARTSGATERDANGSQQGGGGQQSRRNLTPEEIAEAVKYLEGLSGVKDNNLHVRLDQKDGITVVYVEDVSGKVIRRIPESELGELTANPDRKSGHLLNRAM